MSHATRALLLCFALGAPLASAACGGTVTGISGNDAGASRDGGDAHDGMSTSHADAAKEPDTGTKEAAPEAAPIDTDYPASHPPMPTVVSSGGPTVMSPVFIPITFPDDPNQSDIVAFTSGIGASTFWSTIVTQYGVGPTTSGTPVILTAAQEPSGTGGTIDDMTGIQPWLQTQVESGALMGTNGPNTIYAIYFPAGTTITLEGAASCTSFGGYHNNFMTTDTGVNITYAVIPRCGSFSTGGGMLSGVDAITGPASHEYLESATDPQPQTNPAYLQPDNNDFIWEFVLGGGEIGDMCAQFPGVFFKPTGFDYTVQRSWSNMAALASHDPCQPSLPGEVYFNSVAVLPDVTLGGGIGATTAVTIPLHTTKTVEVDLYSDGPTSGPWTVQAVDANALQGQPASLSFSWDKTTGQNGDKLHLTISTISDPATKGDGFIIQSQLGSATNFWIGLVQVDAL
jgi:hypothetical protein